MVPPIKPSYAVYRFPPELISHIVWLLAQHGLLTLVDRHPSGEHRRPSRTRPPAEFSRKERPSAGRQRMSRRQFLVMVGAASAALAGYRIAARAASGGGHHRGAGGRAGRGRLRLYRQGQGRLRPDALSAAARRRQRLQGGGSGDRGRRRGRDDACERPGPPRQHEDQGSAGAPPAGGRAAAPDLADHGPGPVRHRSRTGPWAS